MKAMQLGIGVALSTLLAVTAIPANAQIGWPYWGTPYYGSAGVSIGVGSRHSGFYFSAGVPYYNSFPGLGYYQPGYQFYNGYWFPQQAFVVTAPTSRYVGSYSSVRSEDHVQWCLQRYRSYRVSDDTFQPYVGPRQLCIAPFD